MARGLGGLGYGLYFGSSALFNRREVLLPIWTPPTAQFLALSQLAGIQWGGWISAAVAVAARA